MEGGLFCLQQVALILAFTVVANNSLIHKIKKQLTSFALDIKDVQSILREAAAVIKLDDDTDNSTDNRSNIDVRHSRKRYIEFGAVLGALSAEFDSI